MRWPWQAREYVRTCTSCGYTWRVPREAARHRVGSIRMFSVATRSTVDRSELDREVSSISAANQLTDSFRHCPRCAGEEFGQRPWRGEPAADDGARPGG